MSTDKLKATGHNNGGCCEKCWREAATLYAFGQGNYESHTEAYYAVLKRHEDEVLGVSDD